MGIGFYGYDPSKTGPSGKVPVEPPPRHIMPVDPAPWIDPVVPPEDQKRPPNPMPPVVIIEPVEKPPLVLPPPPDLTPPSIVPPEFEDSIPEPLPMPPTGNLPPVRPPPTVVALSSAEAVGTFMVYVGKKLVLTMAAALGTSLGKQAGAMLVGAVQKQLFRGTTIRFHSGQSHGLGIQTDYGTHGTAGIQLLGGVSDARAQFIWRRRYRMGRCVRTDDRIGNHPGRVTEHGRTAPIPRSAASRNRSRHGNVPVESASSSHVPSRREKAEIEGASN